MNIIFYMFSSLSGSMLGLLLDEAKKIIEKNSYTGVYFVMCEGFLDSCLVNPKGNSGICYLCKQNTRSTIVKQLGENVRFIQLSDYYENKYKSYHDIEIFNSNELKRFTYKNIPIGYGVLSSYIHLTRNHQPRIDNSSKAYFKSQLFQAMKLIDAFENIIDTFEPNKIASFNGRFGEIRPVFELAKLKGVDVDLYEFDKVREGVFAKVVFNNVLPHSVIGNSWKFDYCWNDSSLKPGENIKIGNAFFENRRKGIEAGDKVYISNQKEGLLPSNWDYNKINIVIFNSSEDEYVSIGEEWENLAIFESQIEGLRKIFDKFSDSVDVHFYLRIHPNLASVKYKYHTDLYSFETSYKNVTVVSPDSTVNSYSLLDASEKVIVFGSTMGLEAVYWGKPVILLGCAWYYYSDLCYLPKDENEVFEMIKSNLSPKYNENLLKIGLFMYNRRSTFIDEEPYYKYVNFNPISIKAFRKSFFAYHYQKTFGSVRLNAFFMAAFKFLSLKISKNKFDVPLNDE